LNCPVYNSIQYEEQKKKLGEIGKRNRVENETESRIHPQRKRRQKESGKGGNKNVKSGCEDLPDDVYGGEEGLLVVLPHLLQLRHCHLLYSKLQSSKFCAIGLHNGSFYCKFIHR
jgi:hypothetical protein